MCICVCVSHVVQPVVGSFDEKVSREGVKWQTHAQVTFLWIIDMNKQQNTAPEDKHGKHQVATLTFH